MTYEHDDGHRSTVRLPDATCGLSADQNAEMLVVKACYSDGKPSEDLDSVELPVGGIPGTPGLIPALHALVKRTRTNPRAFVWIALSEPTMPELAAVADLFGLPHLEIDDAANPKQRAKIEIDGERAFVVFKLLDYVEATSDIETGQMSIFVGPGYVVTVQFDSTDDLDWVLPNLEDSAELADHGPASILHAVLDRAVDNYLLVVDELSSDIDTIEESVFSPVRSDDSTAIYELKRENLEIRRALGPLIPGATILSRNRATRLPASMTPYFRDVADHVLRASDAVEANDSLLHTMLQASNARLDLQQNEDMRRISAWVAMAAVPTMLAAIYGMNFEDMPELRWKWGYPVILIIMGLIVVFMYRQFKKSGWL